LDESVGVDGRRIRAGAIQPYIVRGGMSIVGIETLIIIRRGGGTLLGVWLPPSIMLMVMFRRCAGTDLLAGR
jgi:hypothetical protein